MVKDTFSAHEVSRLMSDAILAPLAFAIAPPSGGVIYSDELWGVAKSTVRTLAEYLSERNGVFRSDTVMICASKDGGMYNLNTLKNVNLEGLFSNIHELYKQLYAAIPAAIENHINTGGFDDYFDTLFSQEESTENKK